ncbi:hypothetical protein PUW81_004150 [Microbacterium sp. NM3R9]|uniref:hypothetical protein n=1 Tax=Microbacterium thalli TaxID=3027921 RepID=UPI00236525AE|nr:hypothetical protein [Microbacterium thalli]MDN8548293.1 hypothetical protein [Microbacterium thalli]
MSPGRDRGPGPFVVTLVVDLPIAKPDALDVIAFVSDGAIENVGTAHPRVGLGRGTWAEVQIPKFADPPPLAVDVWSEESWDAAATEAARLADALRRVGWTVRGPRADEV